MDRQAYTAHVVELTAVNAEENEAILEFAEDGVIILSSLCRICANQSEQVIPIYEGEGLEHELEIKMNKYLPFSIERDSSLPMQCCIQCASTLLAWHELYETSVIADRKLKTLQSSTVQQVVDENDKFENGETTTEEQIIETLSETTDISFPEDSAQRPDQYRPNHSESFHQAETSSEMVTLNINDKSSQTCPQLNTLDISNDEIKLESVSTENSQACSTSPRKTNYKKRKSKFCAKSTEPENKIKTEETWIKTETEEIPLNEITEEHSYVSNACWLEKKESVESNIANNVDKGFSEPCQEYSPNNKKGKTKRKESKNKTCNICDKIFKRMIDLRKHSKTHKINDELIISEPDVKEEADDNVDFFKLEDDDSEIECENEDSVNGDGAVKGRSYHCLFCAEIFTSRIELHDHKLANHFEKIREKKRSRLDQEAVNKAKIVVDSRTYYHCTECGKNLHSPYTYIWHNRIHTGERPFVCDLCGKQFRVSQGLVRHLRETHAGIKNFPCDLCGRMFATRRNVEEHRRIHTNERPYICDLCGKAFKQKASLFVHNRSHTDSFPFVCSYCGQGFRTRPPLLVHVTRHTGEKPYACDVCGRCFRIKYELKRHKLIHSDDKPFSCLDCGLSFRQKRYLRNHNKINHNRTTP